MYIAYLKRVFVRPILALAAIAAIAGSAVAGPIAVTDVPFKNGQGTLSGYFQIDSTSKQVSSWSLATSTFGCGSTSCFSGFPGVTYDQNTSTATTGFFGEFQSISFRGDFNNTIFQLAFVLDCGGNKNDCIGSATDGSTIGIKSASEFNSVVLSPFRALDLASIVVSDPPGTLSFNVVAGDGGGKAPEPGTALLVIPALLGLVAMRRKRAHQQA